MGGSFIHDKIRKVAVPGIGALDEVLRVLGDNLLLLFSKIVELRFGFPADHHHYLDLAIKLELLSKELSEIQKASDETIIRMLPAQRKQCKKQVPIFLKMFGWHNRIDDNGNIIYDA